MVLLKLYNVLEGSGNRISGAAGVIFVPKGRVTPCPLSLRFHTTESNFE